MSFIRNHWEPLLITLVSALFFIPFLGGVHLFDWDEINFAEIAREMIVTGDYLRPAINYQPFWEKPPMFFWMQALAMKAFGVGEFAARLPNALAGIASLLVLYFTGRRLRDRQFGLLWALVYFGSVLPHLYFRSGIIDPVFNLFIFLGLYFFILLYWKKEGLQPVRHHRLLYVLLAGTFIGLAVLTKGPVGYLIPLLTWAAYWIARRFRLYLGVHYFLLVTLVALLVTAAWFGVETVKHGTWFVETFTRYQVRLFSTQDAGHGGFPGFHFVVILLGCFPASVFAIRGFYKMKTGERHVDDFRTWMIILFWVVLLLFTLVRSKIVHYSSMAYFPLTFLAALVVDRIIAKKLYFNRWLRAGIIAIGSLYALVTGALPFLARRLELIKPLFEKDPFAMANLEAEVRWTGWESAAGFLLLAVVLISVFLMRQGRLMRGVATLFLGTAVFVNLTLILFIARIEGYSQHAAVEFCRSLEGRDCYIITSGYKSYVHYFYPRILPHANPRYADKEWLLTGDIDKEAYFLTKVHRADELRNYEELEELGSKNGFVFFRRLPPGSAAPD